MLGSAFSIAGPVTVLNTIIADVLSRFADELENSRDFQSDLSKLVIKTIKDHKRIIFNGNGYDASWVKEAKQRGLS
ncbi:MAG: glutamine synthetase type III, partial [Clostridiaceae bacterium]|nr:glutamine synthetase type III [Clostridiaceae bacterium]